MRRKTFKTGDIVDYNSIVGNPAMCSFTSKNHRIIKILRKPNNFGIDVAWITDKTGCVALASLSLSHEGEKP